MSRGQSSKWDILKNVRTVVRSSHDVRDEGQPRGWEQRRDDVRPPANNPPPPPSRPPYGYPQHYPSDPGPHSGNGPWHNSPPQLSQDSHPSQYNENHQYQASSNPQGYGPPPPSDQYQASSNPQGYGPPPPSDQYQASSNPQGYGPPPPSDQYQPTFSQTYGQNQGHFGHPPPASHSPYNQTYQQQPMSSTGQSYQAGQGAYHASYNQAAYQSAGNSYSPALYSHTDTQGTQGPDQNPNFAGPSYPTHTNGGSLTRTVTAPANLHCEHRDPGNGFCHACENRYRYSGGR